MKKLKLDQQKFAGAEVLSRAQLKKVMGGNGSGHNPNCGETNPTADYSCCAPDMVHYIGETDCDSASTKCASLGGNMVTSDPSRCN